MTVSLQTVIKLAAPFNQPSRLLHHRHRRTVQPAASVQLFRGAIVMLDAPKVANDGRTLAEPSGFQSSSALMPSLGLAPRMLSLRGAEPFSVADPPSSEMPGDLKLAVASALGWTYSAFGTFQRSCVQIITMPSVAARHLMSNDFFAIKPASSAIQRLCEHLPDDMLVYCF